MSFHSRVFGAFALLAAFAAPACAQTVPQSDLMSRNVTVMVFSDDADEDTIPRDNRIFNRVIARIQESLNLRGFQVFDETAVTMGYTEAHRIRRTDAEFLEIARSATPKINVAVIFQIYASVIKGDYAPLARPKVRIAGRMLNVQSGQFIGSFEVKEFPLQPLPRSCEDRDCLLENIGDYAGDLGNALAETLADKLAGFVIPSSPAIVGDAGGAPFADNSGPALQVAPAQPATANTAGNGCVGMPDTFIIRFKEFEDAQINQFESLLASFGCYTHHATIRSMRGLVEFTYDTSSGDARLSRNLRLLLDYANTKGTVSQTGNVFEVTQVRTR
ncbi:hypothetical protein HDIA_3352 [Hartmannibacter diazotrophicus]|uniref:Uncharacterized protein n=1 Tax=Hartmannibacter diazotrophicus TaxID=1482074 RepID=A0A2C9D9I4_9HYPH|nr:hypothetical protein [Hartmannibacter diazotrophicus]SON56893.1 hypothetical protein HDIA_3352 [Hartmannibacter diazotrophicus]